MIWLDFAPRLRALARHTRARTALLAIAYVIAHFGGFSHLAAVRHVVCDEHGRLEHKNANENGSHHAEPRLDDDTAPGITGARDDSGGDSHHDGCHLSFLTRTSSFTLAEGPSQPTLLVAEGRAHCRLTPRALASIPVLLLAPKHSPPASA